MSKIWGLNRADVGILRKIVRAFRSAGGIHPAPRPRRSDVSPLPFGVHFAVRVWQDGGTTNGDATTQCDRTYTAMEIDATEDDLDTAGGSQVAQESLTYGTELTPVKRRPETGELDCPATTGNGVVGVGYYDPDGTFALWSANESLNTTAC